MGIKKLTPLFSVVLFDQISFSILFPTMLTFIFFDKSSSLFTPDTSHAIRSLYYGLCVALSFISSITVGPLLSWISDNYGRKKILIIGACGAFSFAALASIGIINGILVLVLIGAVMQGLCWGTNAVAQAIVGDISTRDNKIINMGYLQLMIALGAFAGALLAGYFAKSYFFKTLNFSLPCIIAAMLAAIAILRAVFSFEETYQKKSHVAAFEFKHIHVLFANRHILRLSVMLLMLQLSWSVYYQFIPPLLQGKFSFTHMYVGLFVGIMAFWLAVASTIGVRWMNERYNNKKMIFYSVCFMIAGFAAVIIAIVFPGWPLAKILLWGSAGLVAGGDVIAYCAITALYSDAVSRDDQGKIMGLCFAIVSIAWATTGLLGGLLAAAHLSLPIMLAPLAVIFLLFF